MRPRCLRAMLGRRQGATSRTELPSGNHRSSQKIAVLPSPRMTSVAAWNAESTTLFSGAGSGTHGLFAWSLRCHSHLSCSATPKRRKSMRPNPPSSLGQHATGHATRHWPPVTCSPPVQRKARRRLSICPTAHGERQTAIAMCVGMAESVTAVRVALPARFSNFPFHAGILRATESIRACSLERFSLCTDRGMPR